METISAVIITQNEERNIGRCLQSLDGVVNEVVVVDSGSTDRTEELCRKAGVRFLHHDWAGYSGQKNYADSLATSDWILSIDADEALSDELRKSVLDLKHRGLDRGTVYSVQRLNNYCGHWIHHSGWYPDEKVRLWPRGVAEWDGVVHEELRYASAVTSRRLEGALLHYTYYSVADHADRQLRYAKLAARKAYEAGRHTSRFGVWLRPGWTFIRNYLFKGGFRDGYAGYCVCRMAAYYTYLKYALLLELDSRD